MIENISPKLEDYLEAIYLIEQEKRVARPRDICRKRKVAKSTVTAALQSLSDKGLINYQPYEVITLTETGRSKAGQIFARRRIVEDFLREVLGLKRQKAAETACDMEHSVDTEVLQRFVCFLAFFKQRSGHGTQWLGEFRRFLDKAVDASSCEQCVRDYMNEFGNKTPG